MPKQINLPFVGQGLVNRFALKGRFQPVLDEVVVPVIVVGPQIEPEQTGRTAIGGVSATAAGAGNQNHIFFSNPAGSNVRIVLDWWWATSGTPATDFLTLSLAAGTPTAATQKWTDSSLPGVPKGKAGFAPNAAAVLGVPQFTLVTSDSPLRPGPITLYPGYYLNWIQNVQNTTLKISFQWREFDLQTVV